MARLIRDKYMEWEAVTEARFARLKENEEELNRIFIALYGLGGELSPEVEDKDVSVRKAKLSREIRSLLSYAVGCLFGRYSLDKEGVCYAGGAWDPSLYKTVIPVSDNFLLLGLEGDYDRDLTDGIVDFVRAVYGEETLEENLAFIALALGGKGTPRQVIRRYLRQEFFKDHLKTYQKRPIYWLFSSGKRGFRALCYLHRYEPSLLDRLDGCVKELIGRYRERLAALEKEILAEVPEARGKLRAKREALGETICELTVYEEKLRSAAERGIVIDLDDGVAVNYEKFGDLLAPIQ